MGREQLQASDISDIIKTRIEYFEVSAEVRTEGTIVNLKDGIISTACFKKSLTCSFIPQYS